MSRIRLAAIAAALSIGAACSSDRSPATLDDNLRRDLDLAAATALDLPPVPSAGNQVMETSLIATPDPKVRQTAPAPSRVRTVAPAPSIAREQAPVSGDDEESSVELAAVESSPAEVSGGGVALPRPAPVSVGSTSSGAVYEGGSRGPTAGEVIGVAVGTAAVIILRGGRVGIGDDDCELHRRDRRRYEPNRGGLVVTSRMPVVRQTFPRQ